MVSVYVASEAGPHEGSIETGIENTPLPVCSPADPYRRKQILPDIVSIISDLLEILGGHLGLEIGPGILDTCE